MAGLSGNIVTTQPNPGFRNIKQEARARARELNAAANQHPKPKNWQEVVDVDMPSHVEAKTKSPKASKSEHAVSVGRVEIDLNLPPPDCEDKEI